MSQALNIRQALEKYGKVVQTIKGDSMLPWLNEDIDAVELVPVKGNLQKYDLPLYQRPNGKFVLHRIIDVKKHYYLICGDNRKNIEKVPKNWVVAVASGFYKNGTYVSCEDESYISYVREKWKDFPNREIIKKLPNEWKVCISLFRRAITGREEEIKTPGILFWDTVYDLCKNQMIGAVVFPALKDVDCPDYIKAKFKQLNQQSLRRWLLFQVERESVYSALEEQHIPYMSLKGIRYASLYPFVGAREIADNDVLIHPEHNQAVGRYMIDRGYKCYKSWIHNSYYKKPILNFEFHTKLFQDEKIDTAFRDVWTRAEEAKEGSCEYLMSDEDVYLHTIAHFHKHYVDGGAGLRPFADLYLLRKYNNYDMAYIDDKLEEMGLQEFAAKFVETAELLFDGNFESIPYDTLAYVFQSGAFGNYENRASNSITKMGAKKYFWERIFLPYPNMCIKYPCLDRLPFLLPIFWVVRLTDPIFNAEKRRRFKIQIAAILNSKKNSKKKNG